RARARVDAVERERDRARNVAHRLRGSREVRTRLRDCRLPLSARHPGARTQRPSLPEGDLMTAAAPALEVAMPRERVAVKVIRFVGKAPIHLILVVLGALWLIPTFGLLITSILPAGVLAS